MAGCEISKFLTYLFALTKYHWIALRLFGRFCDTTIID